MEAPEIAPGVPPNYYDRIRAVDESTWWYRSSREIERALLAGRLRPGLRLLDAGCGPGGHLRWAADSGYFNTIAGIDVARQAIEIARARVPEAILEVGPLHALPFASRSFDLVVMHDVLQHIPEQELSGSLEELRRVLDVGGALVVRTNGGRRYRRARSDWRLYDKVALQKTLEASGFRCERLTYANMLPSIAAALRGRTPQAPTEHRTGVPPRDSSRLRARVGSGVSWIEARYLSRPGRSLPYGHSLWAVAAPLVTSGPAPAYRTGRSE